jgi:crotonobetainyl-CoA:carnitine CoA-transferase CaiB-like acyl-CoA transferase
VRRSLLLFRGFGPGDFSRRRDVTPVASPTNGEKECHEHRRETNNLLEYVGTRTQRRDWEARRSQHATAAFAIDGWDERIYDEQEGAKLARAQVKKTFRGDTTAPTTPPLSSALGPDEASCSQ